MNRPEQPVDELILLSAYIDGELSDTERIALQNRLETDPDLRASLASLQATVDLVRSLPLLKAPRDFTLDPALYGRRTTGRIISLSVWRLSSALGVAASIMMVIGSLLVGGEGDSASMDVAFQPESTMVDDAESSDATFAVAVEPSATFNESSRSAEPRGTVDAFEAEDASNAAGSGPAEDVPPSSSGEVDEQADGEEVITMMATGAPQDAGSEADSEMPGGGMGGANDDFDDALPENGTAQGEVAEEYGDGVVEEGADDAALVPPMPTQEAVFAPAPEQTTEEADTTIGSSLAKVATYGEPASDGRDLEDWLLIVGLVGFFVSLTGLGYTTLIARR